MENDIKILIFAHHRLMLDEIENFLSRKGIISIRIDGTTPSETRFDRVAQFQSKPNIRAAVLSITAAGVGLTLTEASTVIFA
jgi:SWI/SNF-related matrix-associated actin-dependent regulator 1 of chromatin subfamily A